MTIWISSGDRPSNGAKALASQAEFKRLRTGKFIKITDRIVNWGSGKFNNDLAYITMLNAPSCVSLSSDKLKAFIQFHNSNVKTVDWTNVKADAEKWAADDCVVVCRTKLTGHSGDGIIIIEKNEPLPDAPLYTKYVFKAKEWRVHVANGKVIDTQQKIKDPKVVAPKTWKVRSHANGFIFARNNIVHCDNRDNLAIAAVHALGLDFGAVDIIEDKKGVLYVLEVNTAPGLEGQTVDAYAKAFLSWQ